MANNHKIGKTLYGETVEVRKHGVNQWHLYINGKQSSSRGWEYIKACAKAASICTPHR